MESPSNNKTFWELIEQLLYSSRGEQAKIQIAAAQAGICRGQVLPNLPSTPEHRTSRNYLELKPNRRAGTGSKSVSGPQSNRPLSNLVSGEGMSMMRDKGLEKNHVLMLNTDLTNHDVPGSEKNGQSEHTAKKLDDVNEKSESVKDNDVVSDNGGNEKPKQISESRPSKSECIVDDLDIVYVKPKKIPSSERLWRFAIKNRKQKSEKTELPKKLEMPNIRSNEAIYRALKKRLQEALQQKETQKTAETQNKTTRKFSTGSKSADAKTPTMMEECLTKHPSKGIKNFESISHLPANASRLLSRLQHETCSPCAYDRNQPDEIGRQSRNRAREEISSNKELYNCIIKRRLYCGNQLDILNKELVSKRSSSRSVLNKDTARKYAELKGEYLNLCYQEAALRHEIAMLHAEIYMMQNKGFHKVPASVKTITLDSNMSKLQPKPENSTEEQCELQPINSADTPLFPKLKTPRPRVIRQVKRPPESLYDCFDNKQKKNSKRFNEEIGGCPNSSNPCSLPSVTECPAPQGVCSLYSLSPTSLPPTPKREAVTLSPKTSEDSLGRLSHRLPKMSSTVLQTDHPSRLHIKINIET